MFKINNCVTLNLNHFILLLVIIIIMVSLYNKIYIHDNYITYEKYKSTSKKYKTMIANYIKTNKEQEHLILVQNQIIEQLNPNNLTENIQTSNNTSNNTSNLMYNSTLPTLSNNGALPPNNFTSSIHDPNLMNTIDVLLNDQTNNQTNNESLNSYWTNASNINPNNKQIYSHNPYAGISK